MSNPKSISRKIFAPIGRALLLACMLATVASSAPAYAAEPVRIGVLAYRTKSQTLAQWQPLAAALKQAIPERDFVIEPFTHEEMASAVASRQLDFVLTNPSQYVLLSRRSGLSSPLATLAENEEGHALSVYGGVIFCRAGQTVFNTLGSLRGKTIAIVGTDSLGGYQMQAYDLIRAGVRLPQDAKLLITGVPHDNVVGAVLAGQADIGFVRTGVLEDMVREGKLEMAQLRIINRQNLPGYSAALSTHLYPNWPFAALPQIDENLARHVTAALFRLEENAAVTHAMRIHGFVVPADYSPLEDLLQKLRLPPFDVAPEFTLQDVWKQYRWWITAALISIAAILLLGYRLWLSNHHLRVERRRVLLQQQQLQESEYRWKFAIEGSGDGLWDWNVTDNVIFFTKRWKEMFGFAENEIGTGMDEWEKRIYSEDVAAALAAVQDCLDAKTPSYVSEHRILCKDGSYKWILDRGMVVSRSEDGKPLRLIGTARDVTEQKRAEMARSRLAAIVESSNDAIVGKNTDGIITSWNKSAESIYGYSADEIIGKQVTVLAPPSRHAEMNEFLEKVCKGGTVVNHESERIRKDGSLIHVALTLSPIRDASGNITGISTIARDITERKQAEEALRRLTLLQRTILNNVAYGVISTNPDGIVTSFNPAAERLLGYTASEVVGQQTPACWHDSEEIARNALQLSEELGAPIAAGFEVFAARPRRNLPEENEWTFIRKDGRRIPVNLSVTALRDEGGQITGFVGLAYDLTEQKRAEEALKLNSQRVQALLQLNQMTGATLKEITDFALPAAVQLTQSKIGYLAFLNEDETILTMHSWSKSAMAECAIIEKPIIYPVVSTGLWGEAVRQRRPVITNDYSATNPLKKGYPEGHVHIKRHMNVPVFDGDRIVIVAGVGNKDEEYNQGDVQQLTLLMEGMWRLLEHKRAEAELRRYKDHLEDVVQQRTADLALALDAAEAANRAKSVFLSSMSHELRTPMNAILGFSGMMRKDPLLSQEQRDNLDIINRSGDHLLTLINDVLDMAKIEAGRVQLESAPIDLGALLRDVTDMMHMRAQEKGLELLIDQSSEFPRYIKGDEMRLRQVLINLIGNAVKFTEHGNITLRLGVESYDGLRHLLIKVEDTGIGIRPEDQQKIFKPFVQLDKMATQTGSGLGLALTQQYVQLMGGTVSVESTFGKGSIFQVQLPLEEIAAVDVVAKLGSMDNREVVSLAPNQPEYRILIVEDQLDNQLLLTKLMKNVGFQVKVADDGKQAVELFQSWRPHLIWMDRRMPVMDGLEATRRIRELPDGKDVKIVAVTASVIIEQRDEMIHAGMDEFVRKPYRFNEIYECMTRLLGVQYIYADAREAEEVSDVILTAEMLAVLPPDLCRELHDALESLEDERITAAIQQVASYDPTLHKTLSHLAENFNYPAILKALQTNQSGNVT